MPDSYGPRVHLWGIDPSQLPSESATSEELTPYLSSIFTEAIPFVQDVPAESSPDADSKSSSWSFRKTYHYNTSAAPVYLYERKVAADELRRVAKENKDKLPQVDPATTGSETWFLRRSTHRDAAEPKTATWSEFYSNFKEHHADSEMAFTDTVVRTTPRQSWDCSGIEIQIGGDTWDTWTLKLEESVHKLPFPLQKRVFPVLQATASAKGRNEFLVVQIAFKGGPAQANASGTVQGAYTSIERIKEVDAGDGGKKIEWVMGTTSNAKGVLPEFVQLLAVPDAVPKDVDFFLGWIAEERKK